MSKRGRVFILTTAATMTAVLGIGAVRYLTFDPVVWANDVNDELSPTAIVRKREANGASAQPPEQPADAELEAWQARAALRAKSMRERFHPGGGECVRYGGGDPPAPDVVDEAAEAIVTGGLATQLGELLADALRWRTEADDRAHAADVSTEVMTHFSSDAGAWERLGLWMHRDAVLTELRKKVALPPSVAERHVRLDSSTRAKELTVRYGRALLPAAMQVTATMRSVDLRAPQIAFLSPGVAERELEGRLGPPAGRTNDTLAWSDPPLEVLLDERREVVAVSRAVEEGRDHVVVGDSPLGAGDEASLVSALGAPSWRADDGTRREVIWDSGAFRRRVLLDGGKLARVELWKKDRLTPPK